MGRHTLRDSPAAIRRAMAMFAPLPPALPVDKRGQNDRQLDLRIGSSTDPNLAPPVEHAAVHVHKTVDGKVTS